MELADLIWIFCILVIPQFWQGIHIYAISFYLSHLKGTHCCFFSDSLRASVHPSPQHGQLLLTPLRNLFLTTLSKLGISLAVILHLSTLFQEVISWAMNYPLNFTISPCLREKKGRRGDIHTHRPLKLPHSFSLWARRDQVWIWLYCTCQTHTCLTCKWPC